MNYEKLIELFIDWNSKINLSAIRDKEGIELKHIEDSMKLMEFFSFPNKCHNIADIGTGSWFPLLPLAMNHPKINFVWIESVRKKTKVINSIADSLWLDNVEVLWTRSEDHKEKYDAVIARAVAYIDKLFEFTLHLLKKWWVFIFYKIFTEEEDKLLEKICKKKSLRIEEKFMYKLYEEDIQRVIYIIKKI